MSVGPLHPKNGSHPFHVVMNTILAIVYIPYSVCCFLCLMATESSMVEKNPLIITGGYIIAFSGLFTALTAHILLFLSARLYNAGRKVLSYIVRFIPIITMVAAVFIASVLEWIAKS